MKALVILAHPEAQSMNAALFRTTVDELKAQGHEVQVSDLYAMKWKSVVDRADFPHLAPDARLQVVWASAKATATNALTDDVKAEQEKLLWADIIVFHFPLWWFGLPAILKGWVDRVFSLGFAYGLGEHSDTHWGDRYGEGRLQGKRAMLVVTSGGQADHFSARGISGPLEDLLFPMTHGMLFYTGMDVVPTYAVYQTERTDDAKFQTIAEELRERLRTISTTKPLAYRPQNGGDYEIPSLKLKPGLEGASTVSSFALHLRPTEDAEGS